MVDVSWFHMLTRGHELSSSTQPFYTSVSKGKFILQCLGYTTTTSSSDLPLQKPRSIMLSSTLKLPETSRTVLKSPTELLGHLMSKGLAR